MGMGAGGGAARHCTQHPYLCEGQDWTEHAADKCAVVHALPPLGRSAHLQVRPVCQLKIGLPTVTPIFILLMQVLPRKRRLCACHMPTGACALLRDTQGLSGCHAPTACQQHEELSSTTALLHNLSVPCMQSKGCKQCRLSHADAMHKRSPATQQHLTLRPDATSTACAQGHERSIGAGAGAVGCGRLQKCQAPGKPGA